MTRIRSWADRIGQLIFTVIVIAMLSVAVWWLGTVTWPHWWFWPAIVPGVAIVVMLAASGLMSALRRERRP